MVTDGNAQSQPVHVKDIEHHTELGRAFSSITYQKVIEFINYWNLVYKCNSVGCFFINKTVTLFFLYQGGSVIRMMRYFLGEETFRKGLEVSKIKI